MSRATKSDLRNDAIRDQEKLQGRDHDTIVQDEAPEDFGEVPTEVFNDHVAIPKPAEGVTRATALEQKGGLWVWAIYEFIGNRVIRRLENVEDERHIQLAKMVREIETNYL